MKRTSNKGKRSTRGILPAFAAASRKARVSSGEIEKARSALMERLDRLDERARTHPSFVRARILLLSVFRRAPLAQRLGILEAARFVIDLIEKSCGLV